MSTLAILYAVVLQGALLVVLAAVAGLGLHLIERGALRLWRRVAHRG